MKPSIWLMEKWRIAMVVFAATLGGLLTNAWLISIILSLLAYIVWMHFKLQQFYLWVASGTRQNNAPDSDGIWDEINYQVLQTKNKSNDRKKRMNALLKRSQSILRSFPYATIVLNNRNEINWSNKKSEQLLNILKKDKGQRIDSLVRSPKLHKLLELGEIDEIEIESPKYPSEQLLLKLIVIDSNSKLLIVRDVSQRNKVQEMRKNFISNASHELRTPLTVILGYLEMIRADEKLPKSLFKAVDLSYEQSERMRSIINDLLTLSRLESANSIDDLSVNINMNKLVSHLCKDLDNEVVVNVSSDGVIFGIETEIISLCTNLIQNAIFYTPPKTKIIVSWRQDKENNSCFEVQDFGQGIAQKHLSKLTERFYRVDKGRSQGQGGTGLGLAIVWHIAQRHNAVLNIKSKVGEGSVFGVCFPTSTKLIK
ncbi:phosphate regulon sensor protein PhoR [Candidatus Thioglobus sp.]|uniref:phosphate regulon sensor histidine kinase PhoR n=1 Tax=Candidatus Thioglobus sp. TaxID=2026721 RepID=UPI003D0A6852